MLSILIPTFNCNVVTLVNNIHCQCQNAAIPFEILVYDDASTNTDVVKNNNDINTLSHTSYTILQDNVGRSALRNRLSEAARYNFLLFLDADVIPTSDCFIKNYLDNSLDYDVVFGGVNYDVQDFSKSNSLRWRYGRQFEQKKAAIRNKTPFRRVISANFMVKKERFSELNLDPENRYGMDLIFGALLQQLNYRILHIDNEVTHRGLDNNKSFIKKTEESIDTLLLFYNKDKQLLKDHKLLLFYRKLQSFYLHHILKKLVPVLMPWLKSNLRSNNANPYALQGYKLLYLTKKINDY